MAPSPALRPLAKQNGIRRIVGAKDIILPAVHPNAGLEAQYAGALLKLVDAMHRSIVYWVLQSYKRNEPHVVAMAADIDIPATELQRDVRALVRRWGRKYNKASRELAKYFAKSASQRTDVALRKILSDGGISVAFIMTPAQRDIVAAVVNENVSLIKSIPSQYLTNVEGLVMRSVQTGRDVGGLAEELEKQYGVTRRRAQLIARDQNNKATSALNRARQLELGIEYAVWQHSHAGKQPRPTHVKNDGKRFEVALGWYDPDPRVRRYIHPGELINCKCMARSIIPGFK